MEGHKHHPKRKNPKASDHTGRLESVNRISFLLVQILTDKFYKTKAKIFGGKESHGSRCHCPSDRSSTGVNKTRVLKKQDGMDSSIENFGVPKELNETDKEVPHTATPLKENSVLDEITDKKRSASYKCSVRYIRSLNTRDPSTLTPKKKN